MGEGNGFGPRSSGGCSGCHGNKLWVKKTNSAAGSLHTLPRKGGLLCAGEEQGLGTGLATPGNPCPGCQGEGTGGQVPWHQAAVERELERAECGCGESSAAGIPRAKRTDEAVKSRREVIGKKGRSARENMSEEESTEKSRAAQPVSSHPSPGD